MTPPLFNANWSLDRRRGLRRGATRAEKLFWACVRDSRLGVKFRRQSNIGPYIADFCAPQAKVVIELDGESHDDPAAKAYDQERDAYMISLGLKVLRFRNEDVEDRFDHVIATIQSYLSSGDVPSGGIPPPYEGGG